ncbi:ABC transporter permease [Frankia sp. CiP3]|uniref:ABC transporter permease n=1 Tax=Frankia sp. CiP3 TaxID=2880971 RepID=UPI001EF41E75|nr:ABC transporter permease [Frankia sp. CiP3]
MSGDTGTGTGTTTLPGNAVTGAAAVDSTLRPGRGVDASGSRPAPSPATEYAASAGSQLRWLTVRQLRALVRQPAYLAITIVQAVVWLPLFGSLFRRVVDVPGFGSGSYFDFLTAGVVVMSALFSAGWSGMRVIVDIDRGVMDRMLTSPVRRSALISSALVYQVVVTTIQSVIIMLLGWAVGTHYRNGLVGPAVLLTAASLVAVTVAACSNALALLVRKEDVLIAAVNFAILPLTFMSSAIMARNLMPGWMKTIARVNPVDWAVSAAREAGSTDPDWLAVSIYLCCLTGLAAMAGKLATRAFDSYRRSL